MKRLARYTSYLLLAVSIFGPLWVLTASPPAGATPPEPTPSCSFTSTFVPADGEPYGEDFTLAQALPTYQNDTTDAGATFDFSCTDIESPEVDFITPFGGGYVLVSVQAADTYGTGPSYNNLPSTLEVTQTSDFTDSDADPSALGFLLIDWFPTLDDAENWTGGYVVESAGVNEWDTLDQGLAYTDGAYTDLYGDGTAGPTNYDPTTDLTTLAATTASTAAPLVVGVGIGLIPLLVVFLVKSKLFHLLGKH